MSSVLEGKIGLHRQFLNSPPPGADATRLGIVRRELGMLLAESGQWELALEEAREAIRQLQGQGQNQLIAVLELDCADRLYSLARFSEAFRQYCAARDLLMVSHGPNSGATWAARERSAMAARSMGDFEYAYSELNAVLEYRRTQAKVRPADRKDLASTLFEMGVLCRIAGRRDLAAQHLEEARAAAFECGDADLLDDVVEQIGALAVHRREYAHALNFRRSVLKSRAARLGASHPKTLHALVCLGETLAITGNLHEAKQVLDQARSQGVQAPADRAICDAILAETLVRLRQPKEAEAVYDLALAQFEAMNHRARAVYRRDLVFTELDNGNIAKAVRSAHASVNYAAKLWAQVLQYGSETDRIAWQSITDVVSACAAVAVHDPRPLVRAVQQFKGAVTESLILDRRNAAESSIHHDLSLARDRLRSLELRVPFDEREVISARRAVERLESAQTVARRHPEGVRGEPLKSPEAFLERLEPGETLVEYVFFQKAVGGGQFSPWYGALVAGRSRPVRWLDLGPAGGEQGFDAAIDALNQLVHSRIPPSSREFEAASRRVHELMWAPIQSLHGGPMTRCVVAPDGLLNLVSPAVLWDGNALVGEHTRIRMVTSASRLLTPPVEDQRPPRAFAAVVADPDYDGPGWKAAALATWEKASNFAVDFLRLRGQEAIPGRYAPLGEARVEGRQLLKALRLAGFGEVLFLEGGEATKERFRALKSPQILHVATHAQFVEDDLSQRNPMLRSWLALTGANRSLESFRNGTPTDPSNGGLLYADEVAAMDLQGTRLVVLSACDTGRGPIRSGEGVFGLRRAFQLAGAAEVILTLWRIHDARTREFMEQFYTRLMEGRSPTDALFDIQSEMLRETRTRIGTAAAARWFGAFVISS